MIHEIVIKNSTRITKAANSPRRRALGRSASGRRAETMAMKTMLSMPKTISMAVRAATAISASHIGDSPARAEPDSAFTIETG